MREPISIDLRNAVLKRDKHACRYCGKKNTNFHMDHVYPVVKGGETSFDNLVTSCPSCNSKKHTHLMWPKPIGYFDVEKRFAPIHTIVLLCFGLGFVGAGVTMISDYLFIGQFLILSGLIMGWASFLQLTKGV